jgi:hypothetical protein
MEVLRMQLRLEFFLDWQMSIDSVPKRYFTLPKNIVTREMHDMVQYFILDL